MPSSLTSWLREPGASCASLCRKEFPEHPMLKGIHLTLMIGPVVPVPVPQIVLDALTNVTVTIKSGNRAPSAFELQFTLSNNSPLQTILLLSGGAVIPL